MPISRDSAGFTLIELVVALALLSVLLAAGSSALMGLLNDVRQSAVANNFLSELAMARTESIRRGRRVVVCRSSDALSCANSGDWGQGRLIFEDVNNNGSRDPSERIVFYENSVGNGWKMRGNTSVAAYVSYHPLGRTHLISGAFQAGTITLCKYSSVPTRVTEIVISSSGRPRTQSKVISSCL